jgi:hypothetical protein
MYIVRLTRHEDKGYGVDPNEVFNFHSDYERYAYDFMDRIVNILGMKSPEGNDPWVVQHGDITFTLDFHYLIPTEDFDDLEGFLHDMYEQ